MSREDYEKAYKLGKKEYQLCMLKGTLPTLPVLNEIMPPKGEYSEVSLGLVQIPIDQIVGTKNGGRSNAFAANFMPILGKETEFAYKWGALSTSHEKEGIREPVKAFEYMNKFYIEEGNKRVSVLKYFDAVSVPGIVTRILPKRTEERENKLYYEFVDFYEVSQINYIWFTKLGSFAKLQKAVGKAPKEVWTDDEKLVFSGVYSVFQEEFNDRGGKTLSITPADAFLAFISLYGYQKVADMTTSEISKLVKKSWEEFDLLGEGEQIDLKMDPSKEKKPVLSRLFSGGTKKLKVGFIYEKTPGTSAWTYAHELGRLHLEQTFPEEITTLYYTDILPENVEETIELAIFEECNIIFTTTPAFAQASVKAAIAHPEIRILNCSLNTSHRYIRTYYARMHEIKFLMGAIAGALCDNDRIGYLGDYPIYGSIAQVNAFALGAKMINPRARIYLEWLSVKDQDAMEKIRRADVSCISGKDMLTPEEASRSFGLYRIEGDGIRNLAMPLWHWGKFYELLIRTIMDGTWKYDDDSSEVKAINYWWGISAGVIDVICSKNIPYETKKLLKLLKKTISTGEFELFSGELHSQNGIVQSDTDKALTSEEIIKMDWLADNIIGTIPTKKDVVEQAKPVMTQQGVKKEED